jgi:hypothetical protein
MTDRRLATLRATLGFPELPPRAGAAADPPVARQLGGRAPFEFTPTCAWPFVPNIPDWYPAFAR